MKKILAPLFLLTFPPVAPPCAAQEVFVVRHAEKVDESRDPDLSSAGRQRAERLATILRDAGIRAIYVTEFKRTQQTAEPLARSLGLQSRVSPSGQPQIIVEEIHRLESGDRVLVVGHSNTVPALLKGLGADKEISIGHDEYDNLFLLSTRPSGRPVLLRLRY